MISYFNYIWWIKETTFFPVEKHALLHITHWNSSIISPLKINISTGSLYIYMYIYIYICIWNLCFCVFGFNNRPNHWTNWLHFWHIHSWDTWEPHKLYNSYFPGLYRIFVAKIVFFKDHLIFFVNRSA